MARKQHGNNCLFRSPNMWFRLRVFISAACIFQFLIMGISAVPIPSYIEVLSDANACAGASGLFVDQGNIVYNTCINPDPAAASILRMDATSASGSAKVTMIANGTTCASAQAVIRNPITGIIYAACNSGIISMTEPMGASTLFVNTTVCDGAEGFSLSEDYHFLYIACAAGVVRVDLNTSDATTIVDNGLCTYAANVLAYSEDSRELVAFGCTEGLMIKDLATGDVTVIADANQCIAPSYLSRDSDSGALFFSCQFSGQFRLDQGSVNATQIAQPGICAFAQGVWHDPRSNVTFASCVSGDVLGITSDAIVQVIPHGICGSSTSIVVANGATFVTCFAAGVVRVSGATVSVAAPFAACRNPQSILIDPDSGAIVTTCSTGIVSVVNNDVIVLSPTCFGGEVVFQEPITRNYLASCDMQGVISINSTSPYAVTTIVDVESQSNPCVLAESIYQDPKSGALYVACGQWGIAQFNSSSGNLTLLLSSDECGSGSSMAMTDSTGTLIVACDTPGVVALSSQGTVTTLVNKTLCASIAVATVGELVFVTCRASASAVLLVNGTEVTSIVTQDMCAEGYGIFKSPDSRVLLISCDGGSSVISIDTQTLTVSRVVDASECAATRMAVQDPLTQGIAIACQAAGVLFATTNYKCSPGTAWVAGACQPCKAQYFRPYSSLLPMGQCRPCPDGFVAPFSGSSSCSPCDAGSYDSKKTCLLCPLGKFQPSSGTTACIDCASGSFAVFPGSTVCSLCDPGFYAATNGSVSCFPCDRGSASSAIGLTHACEGCPAGSYQNGVGKTSCIDCEPHTYAERDNSTSCTRCSSQVNADRTSCTVITCDPNSEFNEVTSQCQLCPLSTYSSRGGLCTTCPARTYTPAAGSGCASCDDIEGLECFGGIASILPGYWAYLPDQVNWTAIAGGGSYYPLYQTAPCPQSFCQGSLLQIDAAHVNVTIQYCAYPRLNSANNTLCARCEANYLAWGDSCVACEKVNGGLAFGYLVFSFTIVIFLLTSSSSTSSAASTSIFLFFIQTAALEMGPIAQFLDWIQIVGNLDPKSAGTCLAPWSAYGQTLFALLIPLILVGELMIIALIHYSLHRWLVVAAPSDSESDKSSRSTSLIDRLRRFSLNDYRFGAISILLFCYTQVATACLRYLHCVEVGQESINFSAPTINCRSGEYKRYLVAVLFALCSYIICFPVMAFITLWRHRESLYLPTDSDALRSSPEIASFMFHWAPFYRMYHPRAYFWQCWVLFRRAAFVVTSVLLNQQASKRFMTFNFLHFASLILHQYVRPYEDSKLNHLETASYVLLMCISELLVGYSSPYPQSVQAWLFILIVPPAAAMIIFIITLRWNQWKQSRMKSARGSTDHSSSTVPDSTNEFDPQQPQPNLSKTSADEPKNAAIEMHSVHSVPRPSSDESHAMGDSILPAYALDSEQHQL